MTCEQIRALQAIAPACSRHWLRSRCTMRLVQNHMLLSNHLWSICNMGYTRPAPCSASRNPKKIKPRTRGVLPFASILTLQERQVSNPKCPHKKSLLLGWLGDMAHSCSIKA